MTATAPASLDRRATAFDIDDLAEFVASLLGPGWEHGPQDVHTAVWLGDLVVFFEDAPECEPDFVRDALGDRPCEDVLVLTAMLGTDWDHRTVSPERSDDLAAVGAAVAAAVRELRAQLTN
ncbi:hypothetical protein [Kitasatospora sp. NPDC058046]|uniref:hypothetical protein n=1 Tax=Kitasatospora sp. NPDC058046 TaxID=3346312 RepID=UPI0036D7DCE0